MLLYTLTNTITEGEARCLNGKIMKVLKNSLEQVVFFDVQEGKSIWITTPVTTYTQTEKKLVFNTQSGSTYDLTRVDTLLPTTLHKEEPELKLIDRKEVVNDDGSRETSYIFNRDISFEKFTEFLVSIHPQGEIKIDKEGTWFEDYGMITGSNNIWTHHVAAPSTVPADEDKAEEKPELKVINTQHDHKDINYGDGYSETTYTFNRDLSREEFIEFLFNKNPNVNLKDKKDAAWYEDYAIISGKNSIWTYRLVRRYTD